MMVAWNQDTHELKQNLLEPLAFGQDEYQKYKKTHVCALCGLHLFERFAPKRMYYLCCPDHGPVFEHTITHKKNMAKVEEGRQFAERELNRKPSGKSADEILKELGY